MSKGNGSNTKNKQQSNKMVSIHHTFKSWWGGVVGVFVAGFVRQEEATRYAISALFRTTPSQLEARRNQKNFIFFSFLKRLVRHDLWEFHVVEDSAATSGFQPGSQVPNKDTRTQKQNVKQIKSTCFATALGTLP